MKLAARHKAGMAIAISSKCRRIESLTLSMNGTPILGNLTKYLCTRILAKKFRSLFYAATPAATKEKPDVAHIQDQLKHLRKRKAKRLTPG
jgi:hypothetical protein